MKIDENCPRKRTYKRPIKVIVLIVFPATKTTLKVAVSHARIRQYIVLSLDARRRRQAASASSETTESAVGPTDSKSRRPSSLLMSTGQRIE